MIILFESYKYEIKFLQDVFGKQLLEEDKLVKEMLVKEQNSECKILHVGYFYINNQHIFILPKIFVQNNEKVCFSELNYEYISLKYNDLDKELKNTIHKLTLTFYRSLSKFKEENINSNILQEVSIPCLKNLFKGRSAFNLLDVFIAIKDFNKKYKNLFLSKTISDSQYGNRVNWNKTISKNYPFIINNQPIYPTVIAKRKAVDFEEPLLCLFYSVINYFNSSLDSKIQINPKFNILKGKHFSSLLNGKGTKLLKKLKSNYFSDIYTKLWELLYLFFEISAKGNTGKNYQCLISKNYEIVIESMVDNLINDDQYKNIKHQQGRRIDHLYKDQDLFNNSQIFYIVDSKYYKTSEEVKSDPLYKQFIYARNIQNYEMMNSTNDNNIKLYDPITEGFNIIPNLFISPVINSNNFECFSNFTDTTFYTEKKVEECQTYFRESLFDRDTLFVQHYYIDYFFLLHSYIKKKNFSSQYVLNIKNKIKKTFISIITDRFELYKLSFQTEKELKDFVKTYFFSLHGKIYTLNSQLLILAIRNDDTNKDKLKKELENIYREKPGNENFELKNNKFDFSS